MQTAISAADANRNFSGLLGQVKSGRSVTITSHGQPVARIVPMSAGNSVTSAARAALFERLKAARVRKAATWTRDELYEESR